MPNDNENLSERKEIRRHLTSTMFSITKNIKNYVEDEDEKKLSEYDFLFSNFLDMLSQNKCRDD